MEEAEKRRERLRANRTDSPQSGISSNMPSPWPVQLVNPLAQPSSASQISVRQSAPIARFDYYTDPMSAFSGSRIIPSHKNFSPATPSLPSTSPGGPGYLRSPLPVYQYQYQHYSSHQMAYNSPMPVQRPGQWRSAPVRTPPFSDHHSPVGYRGISRGFRGTGSPNSNYGRGSGSGSWRPGSYGRGRGRGEFSSAHERPELFSNKMMVIDPWLGLEPVVGRIFTPPAVRKATTESPNSWLPSSIRTKKVKVQESISGTGSQMSLAQSIAMAFEEAAKEEGGI